MLELYGSSAGKAGPLRVSRRLLRSFTDCETIDAFLKNLCNCLYSISDYNYEGPIYLPNPNPILEEAGRILSLCNPTSPAIGSILIFNEVEEGSFIDDSSPMISICPGTVTSRNSRAQGIMQPYPIRNFRQIPQPIYPATPSQGFDYHLLQRNQGVYPLVRRQLHRIQSLADLSLNALRKYIPGSLGQNLTSLLKDLLPEQQPILRTQILSEEIAKVGALNGVEEALMSLDSFSSYMVSSSEFEGDFDSDSWR